MFRSVLGLLSKILHHPHATCIVSLMNLTPCDQTNAARRKLPETHLESIRILETAYLSHDDPIRQSGFGGGAERWRAERSPLLEAINGDGDFLDLGCANGYLLESVVGWARELGIVLNPHGVDMNARLLLEAMRRFPELEHQFWVANAWGWFPTKRFRWVYAIWDLVPAENLPALARHLLEHAVDDGGALIFGAYGSKSDDTPSFDIAKLLRESGFIVAGEAQGGALFSGGPVTRFTWVNRSHWLAA